MLIDLQPCSDAEVRILYDSYQSTGEPDAPTQSFEDLSPAAQDRWQQAIQRDCWGIWVDHQVGGWISQHVTPDNTANLGFGLLVAFRGTGLMTQVLQQTLPRLMASAAPLPLVAATRSQNIAAIYTLQRAGFRWVEQVEQWEQPYLQFELPQPWRYLSADAPMPRLAVTED